MACVYTLLVPYTRASQQFGQVSLPISSKISTIAKAKHPSLNNIYINWFHRHNITSKIMANRLPSQWLKLSNYAFKLYIEQQPFPKILLGFDLGLKSTGVSVSSSDLNHAFYLTTLKGDLREKAFLQQATSLILKEKPVGLVIGKPNYVIESNHNENIMELIDKWVIEMGYQHPKTSQMRYTLVDESWTTLSAKSQLKAIEKEIRYWGHLRKQKDLVDGMAAINILRRYLEFYHKK